MTRVKYQHYVPRFYLEAFAENGKIWCYDKSLDRQYRKSPERLGGETYFYDLRGAGTPADTDQLAEKWLNLIESRASTILHEWRHSLGSEGQLELAERQRSDMAIFLSVQYLRTPESRAQTAAIAKVAAAGSFFNYLGERNPDIAQQIKNPIEELNFEFRKAALTAMHVQRILDPGLIETLATILMNHIWIVWQTSIEDPLYTSDHPVVKHAHARHPVRSLSGLGSPGIQVSFPLSPRFTLTLLERAFWAEFIHFDGKVHPTQLLPENVAFENSLQVAKSTRFLYCRKGDFTLAKTMCAEEPILRDPERPRLAWRRGDEIPLKCG